MLLWKYYENWQKMMMRPRSNQLSSYLFLKLSISICSMKLGQFDLHIKLKSLVSCQEMVAKGMDISTIIKMLSSNDQPIRHASLLFLLELSRSQSLCEKIGSVTGGILMLVTIKYNWSSDVFALEKADEILKNLETSPNNIKRMAENGYLEPLLHHLIEGNSQNLYTFLTIMT